MKQAPNEKLRAALETLTEFVTEPVMTKRDVAGVLAGFSFTFELAWKAVQVEIAERGYQERDPRPSLQAALVAGIISPTHADVWSEMLADRNAVAHTYRPADAGAIVDRIRGAYLPAFQDLLDSLRETRESGE
jgi:nucleotidyltransferase substrate binding protein (TIGR01987 family)